MKITFQCPTCKENHNQTDPEFKVITTTGANYWCCSADCAAIAESLDTELSYADLRFEDAAPADTVRGAIAFIAADPVWATRHYLGNFLSDVGFLLYRSGTGVQRVGDRISALGNYIYPWSIDNSDEPTP